MKLATLTKTAALAGAWFLATAFTASAISISAPTASRTYASYVRVTWPASPYARKGYNVYRTPTAKFKNAVRLGRTTSRVWVDRKAGSAREYYYWVEPVGYKLRAGQTAAARQGGWRNFAIPKPVITCSTAAVTVKWGASGQAKNGYYVYRGTSTSFAAASRIAATRGRAFRDTTAYPGRTYYYWIVVRGYNVSVYHATKRTAGCRKLVVPVPSGKWTGNAYDDPFYLSWKSVYGATKYRVYRGTHWTNASLLYTTTGTTLYDYTVPHDGVWYYYWVCPVDIEGYRWYNKGNWCRVRQN